MDGRVNVDGSDAGSSYPMEEQIEKHNLDGNSRQTMDLEVVSSRENDGCGSFKKSRKKTSRAWNYFDIVEEDDIQKAKCKRCNSFLSYKSGGGTTHLTNHGEKSCPERHLNLSRLPTPKHKIVIFDQEVSRRELVKMVVLHEYPLSIVDHMGFRNFVKSLNEEFIMISRNTLRSDVLKMYDDEKISLKDFLENNESRVAITTDMWTASNQKKGYMAVTAHFIDREWVLHNRTLRFCFVPCPHTKEVLAKVLLDCFSQYSLENKISSVVLDNCTTNDAMIGILMEKLESSCLMSGGAFLHLRCSAHILNLIVKEGLEVIDGSIVKVRDCVQFWMSTPKRIEKFEDACRLLNVTKPRRIGIDCKTRWNSTFLMLGSSLPFKEVFGKLKRLHKRLKFVVPTEEEWTLAALVCQKLEIFHKATKVFSSRKYPAVNLFFRNVCEIRLSLKRWEMDSNEVIKKMAAGMIQKFDKYWSQINGILAVAAILDPRNKMDCVAHYFMRLYGDNATSELTRVRNILDEFVLEYQSKSDQVNDIRSGVDEFNYDEDEFARAKRQKVRIMPVRSEVDLYLECDTLPENNEFDILDWWKRDQMYPTLQKITKDILAIPVSSVASESAFSLGGRVVSAHRSRLHSQTVEALMCLQSWMADDVSGAFEGTRAYCTVDEDCDDDEGLVDIIDMDIDDVSSDQD